MNQSHRRRRLDFASVKLTLLSAMTGTYAYWLIETQHVNALVFVPSIAAVTIGVTHLFKWEAPREEVSTKQPPDCEPEALADAAVSRPL